jgi:hypothetical protein
MNAVIAVFNSLIVRGLSQYTAEYRSLSAQRLSESTVYIIDMEWTIRTRKLMTTIVVSSINTDGDFQVDPPGVKLRQNIQVPIYKVTTEKKSSNEHTGKNGIRPELYATFRDIMMDDFCLYIPKR